MKSLSGRSRGGVTCYVPGCKNSSYTRPDVSFHRIPLKSEIRDKWLRAIQRDREPSFHYVSKAVCSDHFNRDDFWARSREDNKKLLKNGIVPTLELPLSDKRGYLKVIPQSLLTGKSGQEAVSSDDSANVINKENHKEWMVALGRSPDEKISDSRRVCSKHFSSNNYVMSCGKIKLKDDALPDIVPKFAIPASMVSNISSGGILEQNQAPKVPGPDTPVVPISIKMDDEEVPEIVDTFSFDDPMTLSNVIRVLVQESVSALEHPPSIMQKTNERSDEDESSDMSSTSDDSNNEVERENNDEINDYLNVPREFVEAFHNYAVSPAKLADKLKRQESAIGRLKMKVKTMDKQFIRLKLKVDGLERTLKDLGLKKRTAKKKKSVPKDVEKILDVTHNGVPIYLVKAQRSADEITTESLRQEHNYVSASDSS